MQNLNIKMEKTINKLFAFSCWLLAIFKIKAKGEKLIANGFNNFYLSFYLLIFDISFAIWLL
jgi:hypothetical protein